MSQAPQIFGQPPVHAPTGNGYQAKKVSAYINIALPRTDGKEGKIDRGLRLYFENDTAAKELAEYMQTPEGVEWFKASMVVTCNIVEGSVKAGFAIPSAVAEQPELAVSAS